LETGDWSAFLSLSSRFRRCLCVLPRVFDDEKQRQQRKDWWKEHDNLQDSDDFNLASRFYDSPVDVMRAMQGIRGGRNEVKKNQKDEQERKRQREREQQNDDRNRKSRRGEY
jgi:hypothetical protein